VTAAKNNSCDIHITRVYDAPIETVWDAWTDPEQAAQWWGPRGFTLTTHSKDLREGGVWHYTMHGPDGVDYPNRTVYLEVEQHQKLVYDHGASDDRPPLFRVTVLFASTDDKTTMDMTMTLPTPEQAEETRRFIKEAGGNATWDRLAEFLDKASTGKERFVINRSFEASLDVMFQMWTDPDHLAKWLPPAGFEMKFLRSDIRPGGATFFQMTNHDNVTLYARAHYQQIEQPGRIVYTQEFCDESENLSRHPMAPVWPATMLTTVELTSEGPDRTRVTVGCEPIENFTPEELNAFVEARAGMTQGWTGSFDKLEAMLTKQPA
jgi:uncharacterized protein YndB with AHSA1/START domain